MTAFLIVGIIALFYWMYDSAKRKEKADNYRNSTRGSRQVEKEEWERYLKLLTEEYCSLAGITVDFEKARINPYGVEINYGAIYQCQHLNYSCDIRQVFGNGYRPFRQYIDIPRFTDRNILEQLRIKHGLPSDYELNSTILGNSDGSTNYKHLLDIMSACVMRAVKQRGYNYGGTDYTIQSQRYQNLKNLHAKYDWMDPDKKDKK